MDLGLSRKTQKITVATEWEQWASQFEKRLEKQLGFRSGMCLFAGRSSDFLLIKAGRLNGFKLVSGMRPICILKREFRSEYHVENGLELGGELGDYGIGSLTTLYFVQD